MGPKLDEDGSVPENTHEPKSVSSRPSALQWEFVQWLCRVIVEIFFREISLRSSFNLPLEGPTLVCFAPHANQFLDAAVTMYGVNVSTGRNTRYIEAAASMERPIIGPLSKLAGSIPVERPQDSLKPKAGLIKYENYSEDELVIIGQGTRFTKDVMSKGLIGLPHSVGNAKVGQVISDTKLKLAAPMKKGKSVEVLSQWTPYQAAPRVDNHFLFDTVFDSLHEGDLIAIAPEGGSHDRTELLPLKPGVAIMALGGVTKYPNMKVKIVPCGLNYFHPEKFRSRAVLDIGRPIVVDSAMAQDYKADPRVAVNNLMDQVTSAMKAVTIQSPDYETLQLIQAVRRLYSYSGGGPGQNADLNSVVEMNRWLLKGYADHADDPEVKHLMNSVLIYNKKLRMFNLRDHQVENASRDTLRNGWLLINRLFKLLFFATLALPGTVLFSPVFILCRVISKKKQREALAKSTVKIKATDVLGSWKVLIALGIAPILYFIYSVIGVQLINKYQLLPPLFGNWFDNLLLFVSCWAILVWTTYAAFRFGEVGMDIVKSIQPLLLSLSPRSKNLDDLKDERSRLALEVTEVVNDLGPEIFSPLKKDEEGNEEEEESETESDLKAAEMDLSTSDTGSLFSGFSEPNVKMPNLSHVSVFPDQLQLSDTGSAASSENLSEIREVYTTGRARESSLSARVRNAVLERNLNQDS